MIEKKIHQLQKILQRLTGDIPQTLIFYRGAFPDVGDSSTLQFEVHGNKIFYNLEIKKFPGALLKFFLGEYNVGIVPLSQGLSDAVIYFELEHLILETIRKIPKKEIAQFIDVSKPLLITRNKTVTAIPAEVAETIQEKAALFYFNFSPKYGSQFLRDFPATNDHSFAITLLILVTLNFISIQYVEKIAAENRSEENLFSAMHRNQEIPSKKNVQVRLDNLKKILQKVKHL